MKYKNTLKKIVKEYTRIIDSNLVGIYLHGSMAMECATSKSDIDLLIIVEKPLSKAESRLLIDVILGLKKTPAKGIEMSVVLYKYCQSFVYPTPFDLHYSDTYKEKYTGDSEFICGGNTDKDLASHFMVTRHRGVCLYGKPVGETFLDIPKEIYINSLFNDISDAQSQIYTDPVYHILNLCRTYAYIKESKILSKSEGGEWALKVLNPKFHGIISAAREIYRGKDKPNIDAVLLGEFVEYMYNLIGFSEAKSISN